MKRFFLLAALVLIAGCGEAASEKDPEPLPSPSEIMSHDLGPFFQVEMKMVDRLAAVVGSSPSDTWVRIVMEHHRGGVEISQMVLDQEPPSAVAAMARATIGRLSPEIDELRGWVRNGSPSEESALIYRPTIERMHNAMMSAEGANASDTWLRKMLEHHRGAVALCDVLLAQEDVPAGVQRLTEELRRKELGEIAALERLLPA